MLHTDECPDRARGEDDLVTVAGEVRRELMRTDRRGRRYLRFSLLGAAGSTRCYWFLGAGSRTEALKYGHRYVVRGQPRWFGDQSVLVVRSFAAMERGVRSVAYGPHLTAASRRRNTCIPRPRRAWTAATCRESVTLRLIPACASMRTPTRRRLLRDGS